MGSGDVMNMRLFLHLKKEQLLKSENMQGSQGIRQWPINQFTSLIMINKITPFVDQK